MTTTTDEIKAIYGNASSLTDLQIESVCTMVSELVAELLASVDYSATMANAIERYLVAHFLVIAHDQGGITRKRTGTSEEEYRSLSTDTQGLASTLFGQQALALDFKGALTKLSANSIKAEFRVI